MTSKEFYTNVLALTDDIEMMDFANEALSKLAEKSARAKEKRIELAKENEPLLNTICDYLTDHKTALSSELASVCGISTSKASAMCKKLVESGKISKREVSIPKVGKRMAYSLIK